MTVNLEPVAELALGSIDGEPGLPAALVLHLTRPAEPPEAHTRPTPAAAPLRTRATRTPQPRLSIQECPGNQPPAVTANSASAA
jgi:hypothetical protein